MYINVNVYQLPSAKHMQPGSQNSTYSSFCFSNQLFEGRGGDSSWGMNGSTNLSELLQEFQENVVSVLWWGGFTEKDQSLHLGPKRWSTCIYHCVRCVEFWGIMSNISFDLT